MTLQSTNSPFNEQQVELLNSLLPSLTNEQKQWLSGYMMAATTAGTGANQEHDLNAGTAGTSPGQAPAVKKQITILYGSQTGNGQQLAEEAKRQLEGDGFAVELSSMHTYKAKELKTVHRLLVIVSTHGEGEPPDNAMAFHEFLMGRKAPKLNDLQYAVLALGDSSYEFYCETGKQFDQRLAELGGTAITPRVDCDIDFDEDATTWLEAVRSNLQTDTAEVVQATPQLELKQDSNYSRTNPFHAEILENICLNGQGSLKETRHLELSLEGSGFQFKPGDSVGIYPENDEQLVDALLSELNYDGTEFVSINKKGEQLALKEALTKTFEITIVTKPVLEKLAAFSSSKKVSTLLESANKEELQAYIDRRDLLDVVRDFGPFKATSTEFASVLRKIPPRLYSIASSYEAEPDEVHLTVSAVRYDAHGRPRAGVCSVQCAERKKPGDTLPIFIQRNDNFRLPEKQDTPIIMVGPGTGVAPYRSFIEEREALGTTSPAWLFFGDQHFTTDFLYQLDWQRWLQEGFLTKMDVAFSRDGVEKVYVQHKMREHASELYQWLEQGAAFYVCGDEKQMAKDVHDTLLAIIEQEGNKTAEQSLAYLTEMQQQNRYLRDVY
ncbi:sulfite reductase (NADPH) flavoprotein alpha-component [Alkalihalobacillus xiaoxiensis]|uniref:Sulfite reductase (NADPH) flavoprotein alpha-component n=1 Tax=Shouchella xiaoxiensis TaxID=766895 RepID=A0ABS2STA5_9BACI|nr:assimilatory sulfite reductase (NADPH) flavoprotein subunit [Shouchella xiaoxiensis]MBM7838742.1 sulfite reductase (NADPH) flavoprotein alpha-component [Shouchella xiaoxiensis]